jgi:hypothetical protein
VSDLLRWTKEGATGAESALLEASRGERAPANARARTLTALGVSTAVATTAVTTTTTAAAAPVASASAIGWGLAVKVVGLSIVAGGVLVGALAVRAAHKPAAPPMAARLPDMPVASVPAASVPAASASSGSEGSSPLTSAPAIDTENPAHTGVRARPRSPAARPSTTNDHLAREVVALEHAQQALAAHDPAAALRWLDQYHAEFPGGALASDATVLRVQALLTKGDRAGAKALADRYAKDHPDSPYAKHMEDLARDGTTP